LLPQAKLNDYVYSGLKLAVVASGSLGRRLFGLAAAQTLGEAMAACIAGHVNQMLSQETTA
jgi:hypothetical protein